MRSFLPSRRFLKDRRLPEGKGGPFGAPSALSVYIVLLRKGMSQWFGMGPLCGPGSEGSKGSACLWQAGSEGGGLPLCGAQRTHFEGALATRKM